MSTNREQLSNLADDAGLRRAHFQLSLVNGRFTYTVTYYGDGAKVIGNVIASGLSSQDAEQKAAASALSALQTYITDRSGRKGDRINPRPPKKITSSVGSTSKTLLISGPTHDIESMSAVQVPGPASSGGSASGSATTSGQSFRQLSIPKLSNPNPNPKLSPKPLTYSAQILPKRLAVGRRGGGGDYSADTDSDDDDSGWYVPDSPVSRSSERSASFDSGSGSHGGSEEEVSGESEYKDSDCGDGDSEYDGYYVDDNYCGVLDHFDDDEDDEA